MLNLSSSRFYLHDGLYLISLYFIPTEKDFLISSTNKFWSDAKLKRNFYMSFGNSKV